MSKSKKANRDQGIANARQGRIGQGLFRVWAEEADAVANEADNDRAGWDFVVDLPPRDASEPERSCKVQVKTLAPGQRRTKISLSNCRAMVRDSIPWFVAILEMDANDEASAVRVVEITGDVMRAMVRALSRKDSKGRPLNQREFALNLSKGLAIEGPPFAKRLFDAIRAAIGDQLKNLIAKHRALDAARKDHPEAEGTFTLNFGSNAAAWQAMAEFAVGLRPDLPVERIEIEQRNLGESERKSTHEGATLGLPSLPSRGQSRAIVLLTAENRRLEMTFETYYSKQVFPFLADRYSLVRLASPHLSLIVEPAQSKFRFRISAEGLKSSKPIPLTPLANAADFFLSLGMPSEPGPTLDLFLPNGAAPLSIPWRAPSMLEVDPHLLDVLRTIRHAARVLERLKVVDDDVVPAELQAQAQPIEVLAETMAGRGPDMSASVVLTDNSKDVPTSDVGFIFMPAFRTAQHVVVGALALAGRVRPISDSDASRVGIETAKPELLLAEVFSRDGFDLAAARAAVRKKAEEILEHRSVTLIVYE